MNMEDKILVFLRRDIALHKEFVALIAEEHELMDDMGGEHYAESISHRHEVEREIASMNDAVTMLFENYYTGALAVHSGARDEIEGLFKELRRCMQEALAAIGDTIAAIKRARTEIVISMRGIDTRRHAITTYRSAG